MIQRFSVQNPNSPRGQEPHPPHGDHPPHSEIDSSVQIGPYAVIGEDVSIGRETRIGPHSVIEFAEIGSACQIYSTLS